VDFLPNLCHTTQQDGNAGILISDGAHNLSAQHFLHRTHVASTAAAAAVSSAGCI
jgi:hypothetical protein